MKKAKWLDRRIACPGPYLALCLDIPSFNHACKHIGVQPPDFILNAWSQATANTFRSDKGLAVIVCLRDWYNANPIEVAGLLVHEAVHIWQEYAENIGEHNPGKEQEAYAIQAISQELMQSFADQVKAMHK